MYISSLKNEMSIRLYFPILARMFSKNYFSLRANMFILSKNVQSNISQMEILSENKISKKKKKMRGATT